MGEENAVIVAIIVAVPTVIVSAVVPIVMAVLSAREARRMRLDANLREDQLAERARVAAELLEKNTAIAAEKQQLANEALARVQRRNGDKLDVIHTLVNSAMTAALQAEYDGIDREIVLLAQVMRLSGAERDTEMMAKVEAAAKKLARLRVTLDERAAQQKRVDEQQEMQRKATAAAEAANAVAAAKLEAGETADGVPVVSAPVLVVPAAP